MQEETSPQAGTRKLKQLSIIDRVIKAKNPDRSNSNESTGRGNYRGRGNFKNNRKNNRGRGRNNRGNKRRGNSNRFQKTDLRKQLNDLKSQGKARDNGRNIFNRISKKDDYRDN